MKSGVLQCYNTTTVSVISSLEQALYQIHISQRLYLVSRILFRLG